ncbi:MAG TPA: hypothetical protein VHG53_05980 [Candidatus Limnocylindria bacterium]|nr:hypothetical protein [Candidatus Limnocylindria bacterium]
MDIVLSLHGRVALAIVLYLAVVGIWGLVQGVRGFGPSANFTGALVIAEVAAVAQGLFGVVLLFGRQPSQSVHILYGVALAVALPLAATLVRGRPPRAVSFAYGFMALFAAGLAVRGITTA